MKNIYLISGLGVDERVFQNLDFSNCKPNVIHWIKNKKNENLEEYCLRLSEQIIDRNELILLGVSFGGIVAVELSKILKTNKIIIISSIKLAVEKPYLYQFAKLIKLLNFLLSRLFTIYSSFIDFLFGVNSKQEKLLLRDFIENNDPDFIKWSIIQILNWKNNFVPPNLIHIHGEKDKLFPFKMVRNTIPIINGGHFMILNKHKEISSILKKYNIIE